MDVRSYAVTTFSYWVLTLSDGALRMLVLLHFHQQGLDPITLSLLFLLYEFCGVVTNAVGGWVADVKGLKSTLTTGLLLQTLSLVTLAMLPGDWIGVLGIAYVMVTQAMSGVAKDLTKMSSKSAIKAIVKGSNETERQGRIWKWVALLTGSKNALKGVGFFLGGALLGAFGFQIALYSLAGAVAIAWLIAQLGVPAELGKAAIRKKFTASLSKSRDINLLSAGRLLLFASRDAWFVVGLPLYLKTVLGWSFASVGTTMAVWTISYGIMQAMAPQVMGKSGRGGILKPALRWVALLAMTTIVLAGVAYSQGQDFPVAALLTGLWIYGMIFAMNSALHSYLILYFAEDATVASDVGFYYMANAWGRLLGTLTSGLAYSLGGLTLCLSASALMMVGAVIFTAVLGAQKKAPA